jgi:uncharacterized membrane protein
MPTGERNKRGRKPQIRCTQSAPRSISVVGDQMSFCACTAHDFGILVGALAHHEERRLHIFLAKQVE